MNALHRRMVQRRRPSGEPLPEDALFVSCVGGTAIDRVLSRGVEIVQQNGKMKKADIVLITDGQSETGNAPYIRQIGAGLGVTVLGFGIGVDYGPCI